MVIPRAGLSRLNFDNGLNKFAYWESPKANDLFLESQIKIGHRADQKTDRESMVDFSLTRIAVVSSWPIRNFTIVFKPELLINIISHDDQP